MSRRSPSIERSFSGDKARYKEFVNPRLGPMCGLGKIKANEKEPGEWNTYDITLNKGDLTLIVNGEKVNEATKVDVMAGKIGVQSEGGIIEFKTIDIIPLPTKCTK